MRILKIQTLRGPNYWSIRRQKLIIVMARFRRMAKPSNQIPGFYEGLVEALPSLEEHFVPLAVVVLNASEKALMGTL